MNASDWEQQAQFYAQDAAAAWDKCEQRRMEAEVLRDALNDVLEALKHCLGWIDSWDPNFTQDEEWPEYRHHFNAAVSKAEGLL